MKNLPTVIFLFFSVILYSQTYIVSKTYMYNGNSEYIQENQLAKFVTVNDEGIYATFYDKENKKLRNTNTFKWSDLESIGNKFIYRIPDGALYVFEFDDKQLRYLFMTMNFLEGNEKIGYEKNVRKFRMEFH